jgi:hypothetical protein
VGQPSNTHRHHRPTCNAPTHQHHAPHHHLDRLHCPTHDSAYLLHGALPNGAEDGCLGRVGHDDAVEAEGAPVAESNLPLSGTSE